MAVSRDTARLASIPSARDPDGDDLLPLSALNDFLFCPRRCYLHRVDGVDRDNAFTAEGSLAHQRVDEPTVENRPGIRIERAVPLRSLALGLVGRCDVVEFHPDAGGGEVPYPVEYKRGKRRPWDNDDAQLAAQAMCLEEMTGRTIPAGAVYHVLSLKRREVPFTDELRQLVRQAAARLHELVKQPLPPEPKYHPHCNGCALFPICMPQVSAFRQRLADHMRQLFGVSED